MLVNNFPTSAYIHIPFCRRRCYYCDFPISVVGDRTTNSSTMVDDYIGALIQEIKTTPTSKQSLQTVFFGGGTPSLLSVKQLTQILTAIADRFGIDTDAEISMEIDPGTFNREQLLGYLAAGVNRISLGIQTFDDELLKVCGRSHSLSDIMHAIDLIKQVGIGNFSLDLISGLPHQTRQQCQASLEKAIAIAPNHLSCYDLVLEPVTAFGKQYQPGKKPLPNDEDTAEMYRLTQRILTSVGYQHYEVSNYAQPGYQCRHNRVYWENKPYYGWGMGAASYVDGKRFTRPRTRREYYAWIQQGGIIDAPEMSATDWLLETLMLGLRLAEGIDLSLFERPILNKIGACLQPYCDRGWVEVVGDKERLIEINSSNSWSDISGKLRLNDPEGFLFSNTILATLFEELDIS